MLREVGIRNSSPPLSKPHLLLNIDVQPFPLPVLPRPDIPVGGRLAHFVEQWEELTDIVGPLYRPKRVQDPFQVSSSRIGCSDKTESVFLPIIARRNRRASQETGSGKGSESRNSRFLLPAIPSTEKEWKVMTSNRSFATKSVHKQTSFQNGDSQFSKTINKGQQLGCLPRRDRCISSCSDTSNIQEMSPFHLRTPGISVHVPNVPKSVHFHAINECSSSALTNKCCISLSIPRRLVNKRSDSQSTYLSHKIHSSNGTKSGFHTKSKEVRFDTNTKVHIYRYGISDSAGNSQSTSEPSKRSYSDYQNFSLSDSSFGTNFPFSFGQT